MIPEFGQILRRGTRRRSFLAGATLGLGTLGAALYRYRTGLVAEDRDAAVFVASGQDYDGPLETTVRDGLLAVGLGPAGVRGRRVLLKPNLVEPSRAAPHMTSHPALVVAVAHVLRGWGATVSVGEGPGHMRDTGMALHESGLGDALADAGVDFVDLNHDEPAWSRNVFGASRLDGFHVARSVLAADLVVSMPKLKTHHWVGLTASMKNLYGVLPGVIYGWPKNVLHHAGIPATVVDVLASLPRTIAVVDAIDCMEGDGPIMGDLKTMGLVVVGTNLPAVDATCARIMGLDPARVSYLRTAAGRLGPIADRLIVQRGERWATVASPFRPPQSPTPPPAPVRPRDRQARAGRDPGHIPSDLS